MASYISKEDIYKLVSEDRKFINFDEELSYGLLVLTGMISGKVRDFNSSIGYLVQVRKKRGEFNSDQYLIRHSNGKITCHENQTLFSINKEIAMIALQHFKFSPQEEIIDNPHLEYEVDGAVEIGFLIKDK